MPFKKTTTITCCFLAYLVLLWGCEGNRPIGPEKIVSLNVSIPNTGEVKSALIGTAANELLYRVDGAGVSVSGTIGPFTTPASSGSFGFAMDIPGGGKSVLSVQLNNAATHQPLAIGAVGLDLSPNAPVTDVIVVDMGSVTRNCYFLNDPTSYAYYTYGFNGDALTGSPVTGSNYDIQVDYQSCTCGAYTWYLLDASGTTPTPNSIAYMGNGNFLNYDYVPVASRFSASSTLTKTSTDFVETNDVYCIKLNTIPGGYAWMQITTPGGPFPTCPTFIFRVNKTLPYYAYDRTTADLSNSCSGTW
jgi:hypothetical protein